MAKPAPGSKLIYIAPWRDGVIALDTEGRLWFGIANYGNVTISATNPILSWTELTTPSSQPAALVDAPVPPFARTPMLLGG